MQLAFVDRTALEPTFVGYQPTPPDAKYEIPLPVSCGHSVPALVGDASDGRFVL